MYEHDDYLKAALAIRNHLNGLLGEEAGKVDRQLKRLLRAAQQGQKVDNLILEVIRRHESTRIWMDAYLRSRAASEVPDEIRNYNSPLGEKSIPAIRYVCPEGDYVWYRQSIKDVVPHCPTHGIKLTIKQQ